MIYTARGLVRVEESKDGSLACRGTGAKACWLRGRWALPAGANWANLEVVRVGTRTRTVVHHAESRLGGLPLKPLHSPERLKLEM